MMCWPRSATWAERSLEDLAPPGSSGSFDGTPVLWQWACVRSCGTFEACRSGAEKPVLLRP
ncbi:hypothetical protein J2W15_001887 [Pseudarthrobacter sulfonivorans]|nr:hypothetical protein [Pseudarthrobacter sulfonivorans]